MHMLDGDIEQHMHAIDWHDPFKLVALVRLTRHRHARQLATMHVSDEGKV